jgi:hypothetical protein
MLDKGLVFRFPDRRGWKPGMMKKEGKNWVWKEKFFDELREDYDIHLALSVSLFTFSAVFTIWRIYLIIASSSAKKNLHRIARVL